MAICIPTDRKGKVKIKKFNRFYFNILINIVLVCGLTISTGQANEIDAENYILKEQWAEAINVLQGDSIITKNPIDRLLLGHACLATKRLSDARRWFDSVEDDGDLLLWADWNKGLLSRHPYNPVAIYLTADAMWRIGKTDKAIEGYELALKKRENFELVLEALRRVSGNEYSSGKNTSKYNRIKLASGDIPAYDDNIDGSSSTNTDYRSNGAGDTNPGLKHDVSQYQDEDFERAISGLKNSLEMDKKDSQAFRSRGHAFHNLGEYDKAIADYEMAISIDPNYLEVYNERGILYYDIGQIDKAISDFSSAIMIDPDYIQAYINRGVIYMETLGEIDKACADWKRACELGQCGNYSKAKSDGYCQ